MRNNRENKSERFRRLAEKRTRLVLEKIRILSNLSNKGLYDYSPEQINKIFRAIRKCFEDAEARFRGNKKTNSNEFTLD